MRNTSGCVGVRGATPSVMRADAVVIIRGSASTMPPVGITPRRAFAGKKTAVTAPVHAASSMIVTTMTGSRSRRSP